jgi:DNA-binding NtrC family response regulator
MNAPGSKSILVIEDDATLNELLVDQLRRMGYEANGALSMAKARAALAAGNPDLALLDSRLPDATGTAAIVQLREYCPVIVLTAYGSVELAVQAVQAGAADYLTKPVSPGRLQIALQRVFETGDMLRRLEFLETRTRLRPGATVAGRSRSYRKVLELIELVAPADTTVLIEGETGVGKELVAQSVHDRSPRRDRPMVPIDCSTLQENLLESELFGHERGAFTGAERKKQGLIEIADGGTIFLDEIGEISAAIQAKLLRVIETARFRRVGGTRDLAVDVRFLAATNRNLAALVQSGGFRADLYYRLSPVVIHVPPLRERREDILPIAQSFLESRRFLRTTPKSFDGAAERALQAYAWPGNVRELRNVIERGLLMSGQSATVRVEHLALPAAGSPAPGAFSLSFDHLPTLEQLRQAYFEAVLAQCGGNKARAARHMGISERSLYRHTGNDNDSDQDDS